MNEAMKALHLEHITEKNAVNMYENLCKSCASREGGMTDTDQMLIADIARAEQIKQELIADIEKRGIGSTRYNGRQEYWQENKSVAQVRAYAEQQRKHLSELRLTPNGRRAAGVLLGDDFDDF